MSLPVRFSRHARNRLRLWRLAEADITTVLTQPDSVTLSEHGRKNAWKLVGGRWIRVSYAEENGAIIVVTVTVRSSGPEGA